MMTNLRGRVIYVGIETCSMRLGTIEIDVDVINNVGTIIDTCPCTDVFDDMVRCFNVSCHRWFDNSITDGVI